MSAPDWTVRREQERMTRVVLIDAMHALGKRLNQLHNVCNTQRVPLPRLRQFTLAPGVTWPGNPAKDPDEFATLSLSQKGNLAKSDDRTWLVDEVLEACSFRPRDAVRVLRRIQAATAWIDKRIEGIERAVEHEEGACRRYRGILEAEAAAIALRESNKEPMPF